MGPDPKGPSYCTTLIALVSAEQFVRRPQVNGVFHKWPHYINVFISLNIHFIALDIILEIRPCPGLKGYSDTLATATVGKRTIPYLVDSNGMFNFKGPDGKDIIDHLFDAYGREIKFTLNFNLFDRGLNLSNLF